MSHIIFLGGNRAIQSFFFSWERWLQRNSTIQHRSSGGGGNSAQVKNWSLLSHSPQDPRINIVNLKLVVQIHVDLTGYSILFCWTPPPPQIVLTGIKELKLCINNSFKSGNNFHSQHKTHPYTHNAVSISEQIYSK